MSSTSPLLSTARHSQYFLPFIGRTTSSRCHLSATLGRITRLKATWWGEYEAWRKRDLSGKRYVYIWADGVYFNPRLDDDRQCMLVITGADEYGDKDVLGIMDGFRENADSWRDLLRSLKKRGLTITHDRACGDGALGFWTALRDVYPNP
jgi:putative transposase